MKLLEDETDGLLLRLMEAHPRLFRGRPPRSWSAVPEELYSIADGICSTMERLLPANDFEQVEVLQIKPKLGGLRFYWALAGQRIGALDAADLHLSACRGRNASAILEIQRLIASACEASLQTSTLPSRPLDIDRRLG